MHINANFHLNVPLMQSTMHIFSFFPLFPRVTKTNSGLSSIRHEEDCDFKVLLWAYSISILGTIASTHMYAIQDLEELA